MVQSDLSEDHWKVLKWDGVTMRGVVCGHARGKKLEIDIVSSFLQFSSKV